MTPDRKEEIRDKYFRDKNVVDHYSGDMGNQYTVSVKEWRQLVRELLAALDRLREPFCTDTGVQAIQGECPTHHGDACLRTPGGLADEVERLRGRLATAKGVAKAYQEDANRWSDACDACINEIATQWEPLLAAAKDFEAAVDDYAILGDVGVVGRRLRERIVACEET